MLSMARALTTDPEILLLDELSMGLAPLIVEELYGLVGQLVASERLTIVWSSSSSDALSLWPTMPPSWSTASW